MKKKCDGQVRNWVVSLRTSFGKEKVKVFDNEADAERYVGVLLEDNLGAIKATSKAHAEELAEKKVPVVAMWEMSEAS